MLRDVRRRLRLGEPARDVDDELAHHLRGETPRPLTFAAAAVVLLLTAAAAALLPARRAAAVDPNTALRAD